MKKPKLLAVLGPTASGKSELAMRLAERWQAEIICADSMQVYRRMDIGTAKPSKDEQRRVPHHMLDLIEPTEPYSVARWVECAKQAVQEISSRGRLPMLVGGTGLYVQALTTPMALGAVAEDVPYRESLKEIAQTADGRRTLHEQLTACDPLSAQKFPPADSRRVIRALEVYHLTGQPISAQKPLPCAYDLLSLALHWDRSVLRQRIAARVDNMLQRGLLDEVHALAQSGVRPEMTAMQGLGYKELYPVVTGALPLETQTEQIKLATGRYAKRQETWLKRDASLHWLDGQKGAAQNADELHDQMKQWIEANI